MAQKQSPSAKDDFKHIKGIGPKTEDRLHQAGIMTYEQLAGAEPDALAQIVVGMSAERIIQENWCGQAGELAPKLSAPGNGQHYATFTVELLLDQSNNVRRTRVIHVQDEEHKETWAGWQDHRLLQFITGQAGLKTVAEMKKGNDGARTAVPPQEQHPAKSKSRVPQTSPARLKMEPVDELLMVFTQGQQSSEQRQREEEKPLADIEQPVAEYQPEQQETVVVATSQPVFEHGRSFDVQVQLDLSQIKHNKNAPLNYRSSIFAVDVTGGTRQKIGTTQGSADAIHDEFAVQVPAQIQVPGTYRLEAEMNLAWLPATSDLTTAAKGSLVHIY